MKIIDEALNGLVVFEPKMFNDERGFFFESYRKEKFYSSTGINNEFVQDNHSFSKKNVIRGLHFQSPPFAQGKLVRVIKGAAYDIVVDIRKNSSTYGKHYGIELNESNNFLFWVPVGFAHGFAALTDETVFLYKCTAKYSKEHEVTLQFNDPSLQLDWKVSNPIVSTKDCEGLLFQNLNSPF